MFINLMACEFLTVIIWLRLYQMQPSSNWVATKGHTHREACLAPMQPSSNWVATKG